ncbi:alpha/beta hydrolase [Acinetobacter sp. ANC 4558]|uniref:alpha/beta hydrolase n=1 Tax=Acinetobacter sp. ANC 4558 TaxID=1977876 RepID=UPI000A34F769|nr:alpha/beta hydrolase [Acinetobacter sp. ANC 4558]OTG81856.1 alpha/beta hydrolase [Acinetobacter sp. ANC 4558]
MSKKAFFTVILSAYIFLLTACQSVEKNSQIIASAFNTATQVQKRLLDRHAPKDMLIHSNIIYMNNPTLHFDLYQPADIAALGQRPTIIWIHGGGWVSGSKENARGYFKRLADQGYNVIAVEYQFAPQHIYPTQLQQINHLFSFITQHAKQYSIDAKNLYLAGDSAGANLASHYAGLVTNPNFAQTSNFEVSLQAQQISGLILHCGIYDLESFVQTAPKKIWLFEWGINTLTQAYTGGRKDDTAFLHSLSPNQYLTPSYPAVFISSGNKDFLTKSQALPFVDALKKHQIPVVDVFYPNSKEFLMHEYQFMMSKKASQETFQKTLQFLRDTSKTKANIRLISE